MARNVTTVSVLFDGEVLRPDQPLNLKPNTRYVVVIQTEDGEISKDKENAWDVLERLAGTIDAPADWAQSTTTIYTARRKAKKRIPATNRGNQSLLPGYILHPGPAEQT